MNVEVAWNDHNPLESDANNDEKHNEDDRFLEEMLAKAARLANEMKEISSKQSGCLTTSSKSSKDGRRSLPKIIDVQPHDDAARSECSSLGYSLATATPSVLLPNSNSATATTPTTMHLLSMATLENCSEGYFLKSNHKNSEPPERQSSTTCSVINEGSITYDDEKKSIGGDSVNIMQHDQQQPPIVARSVLGMKPMFHIHTNISNGAGAVDNNNNNNNNNNMENIQNMSSVDMLFTQQQLLLLRTPPKMKRTSQQQQQARLEPTGTLPLSSLALSSNPAVQSTFTKSLSEDMLDDDDAIYPKLLESALPVASLQRPTVLKISHGDDDYVPIADYSIRNTSSSSTGTAVVQWEKIAAPTINDDDFVSLKDYSNFPKKSKMTKNKKKSFQRDNARLTTTGLSFSQQRTLLLKRRRQRKRFMRRLFVLGGIVMSILSYCFYTSWYPNRNDTITAVTNVVKHVQNVLIQAVTKNEVTTTVIVDEAVTEVLNTFDHEMSDEYDVSTKNRAEDDDDEKCMMNNETLVVLYDQYDDELSQRSTTSNELTTTTTSSVATATFTTSFLNKNNLVLPVNKPMFHISLSKASDRRRFVEDLIYNMMQ